MRQALTSARKNVKTVIVRKRHISLDYKASETQYWTHARVEAFPKVNAYAYTTELIIIINLFPHSSAPSLQTNKYDYLIMQSRKLTQYVNVPILPAVLAVDISGVARVGAQIGFSIYISDNKAAIIKNFLSVVERQNLLIYNERGRNEIS